MKLLLELTDEERLRFGQADRFFAAVLENGELRVALEALEVIGPNGYAVCVPAVAIEVRGVTTRWRSTAEARLYDDAPALTVGTRLIEGKAEKL